MPQYTDATPMVVCDIGPPTTIPELWLKHAYVIIAAPASVSRPILSTGCVKAVKWFNCFIQLTLLMGSRHNQVKCPFAAEQGISLVKQHGQRARTQCLLLEASRHNCIILACRSSSASGISGLYKKNMTRRHLRTLNSMTTTTKFRESSTYVGLSHVDGRYKCPSAQPCVARYHFCELDIKQDQQQQQLTTLRIFKSPWQPEDIKRDVDGVADTQFVPPSRGCDS